MPYNGAVANKKQMWGMILSEVKKRKDEFDIAKALGVFLVILGHMPSVVPESIRIWIFSFHMALRLD